MSRTVTPSACHRREEEVDGKGKPVSQRACTFIDVTLDVSTEVENYRQCMLIGKFKPMPEALAAKSREIAGAINLFIAPSKMTAKTASEIQTRVI